EFTPSYDCLRRCCHHAPLLSFPTRRSSDLYACFGPTPATDRTFDLYWIAVHPDAQRSGAGAALMDDVERQLEARARMIVIETSSDRKSTRLNSSHSQISYAVFCLKKKRALELLLMVANHYHQPDAFERVSYSLEQMLDGGLWDKEDGGFYRYSSSSDLSMPHTEKM